MDQHIIHIVLVIILNSNYMDRVHVQVQVLLNWTAQIGHSEMFHLIQNRVKVMRIIAMINRREGQPLSTNIKTKQILKFNAGISQEQRRIYLAMLRYSTKGAKKGRWLVIS
jgi:hypothetical protein